MTTYEEIETLHSKVKKVVHHPYLERFLTSPEIDRDLVSVYHAVFRTKTPENWLGNAASAILVHVALDTHETVTTGNLDTTEARQQRQLTVLSGDYYSSLYYYLLSQIGNIKLIKALAKGIQSFNNAKMYLFGKRVHNWRDTFTYLYQIETALFSHMAEGLGLKKWEKSVGNLLYLKRLLLEQSAFLNKKAEKSYFNVLFDSKEDLINGAAAAIEGEIRRVENELRGLIPVLTSKSTLLEQFLNQSFHHHFQPIDHAEEG